MAVHPVALILGAGPRIGLSVAKKFASQGYQIAIVSRSSRVAEGGFLSLTADFTDPSSIPALFEAVEKEFHAPPSVVVYNAAVRTGPVIEDELFSNTPENLVSDFNVNVLSAYIAAQQAVLGWKKLPEETKKTFIYTGNALNTMIVPMAGLVNLGLGKSASAYWIGLADTLYKAKGSRFFYADERNADGTLKGMSIDGDAHAEFYNTLIKHDGDIPWLATFVKDQGYAHFK